MRQVATCLAQLDQRFQAHTALEDVFFGQHRLVQAELFHQSALFGLADFHAQRLDLFGGRCCLNRCRFFGKLFFNVGQILVTIELAGHGGGLGLATALDGAGYRCCGLRCCWCAFASRWFGRATGFLFGRRGAFEQGVCSGEKLGLGRFGLHGRNFLQGRIRFCREPQAVTSPAQTSACN